MNLFYNFHRASKSTSSEANVVGRFGFISEEAASTDGVRKEIPRLGVPDTSWWH